jgi:hypothetical protein
MSGLRPFRGRTGGAARALPLSSAQSGAPRRIVLR